MDGELSRRFPLVTGFRTFAQFTPWEPVSSDHWIAILRAAVFVLMGYYFSVPGHAGWRCLFHRARSAIRD